MVCDDIAEIVFSHKEPKSIYVNEKRNIAYYDQAVVIVRWLSPWWLSVHSTPETSFRIIILNHFVKVSFLLHRSTKQFNIFRLQQMITPNQLCK